jgi:hypothetical protein
MKKAISVDKKRGRPPTGERPAISARVSNEVFAGIESWASQRKISHSEAIRRLVELGLTMKAPAKPVSKPDRRLRAAELAAKAIDKIVDPAAPPEERAQRRRRLTKGPEEFREVRVDRLKAK